MPRANRGQKRALVSLELELLLVLSCHTDVGSFARGVSAEPSLQPHHLIQVFSEDLCTRDTKRIVDSSRNLGEEKDTKLILFFYGI